MSLSQRATEFRATPSYHGVCVCRHRVVWHSYGVSFGACATTVHRSYNGTSLRHVLAPVTPRLNKGLHHRSSPSLIIITKREKKKKIRAEEEAALLFDIWFPWRGNRDFCLLVSFVPATYSEQCDARCPGRRTVSGPWSLWIHIVANVAFIDRCIFRFIRFAHNFLVYTAIFIESELLR